MRGDIEIVFGIIQQAAPVGVSGGKPRLRKDSVDSAMIAAATSIVPATITGGLGRQTRRCRQVTLPLPWNYLILILITSRVGSLDLPAAARAQTGAARGVERSLKAEVLSVGVFGGVALTQAGRRAAGCAFQTPTNLCRKLCVFAS